MLLNGSALNGDALNASARSTFILAFCAAVASTDVSAAGDITRHCGSTVAASCEIATSPNQHYAATAAFSGSAFIVAALPYQTFSSASIVVSTGEGSAAGDITRYCLADIAGSASVTSAAWLNQKAAGDFSGSASVEAINFVRCPGTAELLGECSIAAVSFGIIRYGLADASCVASLTANGLHALSANSAAGGTASIFANAGYGIPSATIVLSAAEVYAYAKATRMAFSSPGGSATMTAIGRLDAYGVSNIVCYAQAGAYVIQIQGAANAIGAASVMPNATYVHMSASELSADASIVATGNIIRYANANLGGSAALHVETKVNNLLEGFALPDALSTVILNANGVVVAPLILHFYGSVEVVAVGTYRHMARASGNAVAEVIAAVTYKHMGETNFDAIASMIATGHYRWNGASAIHAQAFNVEAYPAMRQFAIAEVFAGTEITGTPTRIIRATVAGSAGVEISLSPLVTHYGMASIPGLAYILAKASMVGNPDARDPEERTMRRPFTDRTMRRPFVDRTMKATRI